ncbi:hypothetical protein CL653_00570 [bacterium]|nr:hypothetical protein [bacterium]
MKSLKLSIPFIILTTLLAFVGIVAFANAQTVSSTETQTERKASLEARKTDLNTSVETKKLNRDEHIKNLQAKKEEFANRADEARARFASTTAARETRSQERLAAMNEKAQEKVGAMITNMQERLSAITDKVVAIVNRVNSRLDILGERGVDISSAEAEISVASEAIESATLNIGTLRLLANDLVNSDEPRVVLTEVKNVANLVKYDLEEARDAIRGAVNAMKEAAEDYNQSNNEV